MAAGKPALPGRMMAADRAAGAAVVADLPGIVDRYAGRQVIESRETVREAGGLMKITRVRLVRDDSFKYPLIRVEDELVRGPQGERLTRQTAMVGDHVLVKPQSAQTDEAALLAQMKAEGATVRRRMPASGTWLVAFANPTVDTVPRAVAKLSGLKTWVRYAEPDYIVRANATPNDASFSSLWGMHNTGQNGGVADADVDAPEAWNISTGSAAVVVGVIDSGIDQTHPDLLGNLWTNPAEIAGNALDDDGNGYVDDTRGWDFVGDDSNPQDDHGHGTHCAGTIGAMGNNTTGVAGVCWDVSLVGLKFLDATGNGSLSDGVEAIAYATGLGMTLTSNSWGGGGFSQAMKDAIDAADVAGILFVAAAGNEGLNMETNPGYPASYTNANVISVAATTRTDALATYSNYGTTTTDLGAPGSEIYSTLTGGGYATMSGTSMATPHVAGACALLKSFKPGLTHAEIRELLLATVDVTPALTGKTVTGGRLNIFNALLASDDILLTPGSGLTANGPVGGPFMPNGKVFSLTNHAEVESGWSASVDRSWVTLSAVGGTLAPGAVTTLTATLNSQTPGLLAGGHSATLTLTSLATGLMQTRALTLTVNPPAVYSHSLDTDPGWPRTGQWAYGVPLGQGAQFYGSPDPAAGVTGTKVLGINLAGDYSVAVEAPQYVTAGPFDMTGYHDTRLRFQRWLNSDYQGWVFATIEVSTDGVNWDVVWQNGTTPYQDSAWTPVEHDLSTYADGQPQVYVRWGHEVRIEDAYPLSGWNLDDVEIAGTPDKQLRLTLPVSLTEGGATATGKVTVAPAPQADLVISLVSNLPGQQVFFPATVTILAGQEEAFFNLTPLNDTVLDGSQPVTLTASATDWPSHSASTLVHDDESGSLTLHLPASATEGAGSITGQASISLPVAAVANIVISLSSGDITELTVPATVTIPQGQTSAAFTLTVPEDALLDGSQNVTVTATVANWTPATASLQVLDNEPLNLTVTLPAALLESAGTVAAAGTVSVAGTLLADLTVSLVSSDLSELAVPSNVTIPSGNSSATFSLTLVNDALVDATQSVEVTASATGFASGSAVISVMDDEQPALPANPVPADGLTTAHPESDLAWATEPQSGGTPDNYDLYFGTQPVPSELLGNVTSPQWPLPRLAPGTTWYWQVIAHRGGLTRAGPVWTFSVPPVGPLHHLGWSETPAAAIKDTSFTGRITAYDAYDNEVAAFTGTADLSALVQPPVVTTGSGTFPWYYPLATYYHDARTQIIYTPQEAGPAGQITSLALEVSTLPGQTLKDFTIRLKHTAKTDYVSGGGTWETEGWTTVHASTQTLATIGWVTFPFTTPFAYDGTSHLMVDISFNNNSYTTDGTTRTTITPNYRALAYRTDSLFGDPLAWAGNSPQGIAYNGLPNLRLTRAEVSLPLTPAVTGSFVSGVWSGSLTLASAGEQVRLKAISSTDTAILGLSPPLTVVAVNDFALNAEPLITGGTANTLSWAALGTGYDYEIQRATEMSFNDPVSTGYINTTQHDFTSLADAQLYHYRGRARASGLIGNWSAPQRSTQDATPPVIALTPASGGLTALSSLTLTGTGQDASGLATLTVNGTTATTSTAFADWDHPLNGLLEGINTWTITASDNAIPPNIRAEQWTVTRITDPAADPDKNGLAALIEYAFNAAGTSAPTALPAASTQTHSGTQQNHLTLTYRRRLVNPSGLQYHIETSTNLITWQPAGLNAEELTATPTDDGLTETVTLRLHPAISPGSKTFVRIRVTAP